MSNSTYGRLVISDITHYADKDDLEELLRRRFPATPTQPKPWRYNVSDWITLTGLGGIERAHGVGKAGSG